MSIEQYNEFRKTIKWKTVSLGCRTVELFSAKELIRGQVGYSVGAKGESLCGSQEGDWQRSWLVIADESGDPIFMDLELDDSPVFTASHGQGNWEPTMIASSVNNFVKALELIRPLSRGRNNPVALATNPVPDIEAKAIIENIEANNPNTNSEFWRSWLSAM